MPASTLRGAGRDVISTVHGIEYHYSHFFSILTSVTVGMHRYISAIIAVVGLRSLSALPSPDELPQLWPVPGASNFGAHILNVDVENISEDVFDLVHEKLLLHKVIVIRNQQNLTVEGQRRFTQRFGSLHVHLESSSHYPGYSDVNVVSNIKNENGAYIGLFGAHVENFHSDLSW